MKCRPGEAGRRRRVASSKNLISRRGVPAKLGAFPPQLLLTLLLSQHLQKQH